MNDLMNISNHPLLKNYSSKNQMTKAQDRLFNNMLKAVSYKYRVVKGEDKIYEIPCKDGDIEPYSFTDLCYYQECGTVRAKNAFKKKLPRYCSITQEGDTEIVVRFPVSELDHFADIVGAKKKRVLTETQLVALEVARNRSPIFKKAV